MYVSAQYVVNELPPPEQLIRAVDDTGRVWWIPEGCDNSDWLEFLAKGGTVMAANTPETQPAPKPKPAPKSGRRKKAR
jgi:hypothetical protein